MKKFALIILMMVAIMLSSCAISVKNDADTSTESIIFSSNIARPSDTDSSDTDSSDTDSNVNIGTDSNVNIDSSVNTDSEVNTDINTDTDDINGDNKKCPPHSYGDYQEVSKPTCQVSGEYVRYCQECNQSDTLTVEKTEHTFEILVKYIVEPTVTSGGSGEYKCVNCDATETREIPPKVLDGVENIIVEKITSQTIKITFNHIEGAQGYEIYYSGNEITAGNFKFAPKASAEIEGEESLSATFRVSLNIYQVFYIAVVPYVDGKYGEIICIKVN